MLFEYTPISSLTPEQKMRLMQQVSRMSNIGESTTHVIFDGKIFLMSEVKSSFVGQGPQFLKG